MNAFRSHNTCSRHPRDGSRPRAWLALCAWLCAGAAVAGSIQNTATVTYRREGATAPLVLRSNTVVTEVLPLSGAASLQLLGVATGVPGSRSLAIDGAQCRVASGSFGPVPELTGSDGQPIGPGPVAATPVTGYEVGTPILVEIVDANRNTDPSARDYVDVDLSVANGDAETLRLLETGPDTGVFAGAIQSAPIPPAAVRYDCALSLYDGATITARYTDADHPADAKTATAMAHGGTPTDIRLEQQVSKDIVEIGEFVQYSLTVYNVGQVPAMHVEIRNILPQGMRYQTGSLWVGDPYRASPSSSSSGGVKAGGVGATTLSSGKRRFATPNSGPVEPVLDAGGGVMLFNVGDLQVGEAIKVTFVTQVTAVASGASLVNTAVATANGALTSNRTDTMVRMVESLNTLRFTLIGQVLAADRCDAPSAARKGVPHVRMLLDDGTYVVTDENGSYHVEGLRPGTHVVQMDLATLPPDLEPADCLHNTRRAGSTFSQFVEGQGGGLLRADFQLRPKAPPSGTIGTRLELRAREGGLHYGVSFDGGEIAVSKLRAMVPLPTDGTIAPGSVTIDGRTVPDPVVTDGIAIFDLGEPGAAWRRRLEFDIRAGPCPEGGYSSKVVGLFDAGGRSGQRTAPVEAALACGPPGAPVDAGADSGRQETVVASAAPRAASPYAEQMRIRNDVPDDRTAAGGGDVDWLSGQAPGTDWLFPAVDYNPRSPNTRVVIKHLPGQKVSLRIDGVPVAPLNFEGLTVRPDRTVAASSWKSIPLQPGDNLVEAEITAADGTPVTVLTRIVHYANSVARAELVPEQSILVADGITRPVLAIRMLDPAGRPLRASSGGALDIASPYQLAQSVEAMQQQRAALAGSAPRTWHVEGDAGIAYIELQPTTIAGEVRLTFPFGQKGQHQELRAWLKSAPRDWVVVGFAKGSVGYETLKDNMQALPKDEDGKGVRGKGQASLYAKGRVLGKWLMTLSYDTGKDTSRLRNQSLLSTIDPGQYYTLYGDGSQQGYDAASASKLYLKLERDQFYALFGDFQSGLDRNELSRYQRTLNGVKVEYHGPMVEFNGFAAKTSQSYMHDEIQGDGTSGLYRLKRRDIVLNSERIRIETRDRYHSEQVLASKELVRHIDYDIDYDNATLFFREPVMSRDPDFNPNWIVAEYETRGTGEEFLNGGGRAGIRAMDGRLEAGASVIHDENAQARGNLVGVDAKFRPTQKDELRFEAAASRNESAAGDSSGNAWLVEWEHRSEMLSFLAYVRRQTSDFGVGQQSGFGAGMAKAGVQGQYKLGNRFSLQGEVYRQESLAQDATRDVVHAEAVYRGDGWTAKGGVQVARDEAGDGRSAESRQVTLGATKQFLDNKLDLGVQADIGLGGGKDESVDFPDRLQLTAAYKVNDALRLLAAHELTYGSDRDTSTTRVGFEAKPWKNATLTSTVNQSQISEYGPRTFALFGLNQKFQVNDRWSFDAGLDSSQAFNQSGATPLVVDPSQPIQAGGIRDGGALTEDFMALSGGVNYRASLWMWNARVEGRQSDSNDRYGITTAFLRQVKDGVALSASAQAFSQRNADGSNGILANAQLSWAWRPLGGDWSMLDKLEYRLDSLTSVATGGANGGDGRSARLINNFALNYMSDSWQGDDGKGSVLDLYQRSQLSLYYGSKYVIDSYDGNDYAGYSDLLGVEARLDLTPRIDIGLRASVLHSWSQNTYAWAFGPSIGFTPFTNAWVSVGYNIRGFEDRDFQASHYTAKGAYLVFRMKFDQRTLGLDRGAVAAGP